MTRISEVHGISTMRRARIGADEFADRGKQVAPISYVPYLSMSVGEMRLQLAAQRARILSQYYGADAPEYAQAYNMLESALSAGVHGGAYFRGHISDALQSTARLIRQAQYQTAPASGTFFGRTSLMNGIGAIIPVQDRLKECLKNAKTFVEQVKCHGRATVENIVNSHLEGCAHHMLYKNVPTVGVPVQVPIKRSNHRLAVEGLANVANLVEYELMYEWVENGILASNAAKGVGAVGSINSSFYLAPNPEKYISKFNGINGPHIGIAPAIAAALVSLLVSAIGVAQKILSDLQKVDYRALVEAKGFGTNEFSADKKDWDINAQNQLSTGIDTTTLLLLAGGAYLLATQE